MFGVEENELAQGARAFISERFDSPALHAFIDSGARQAPALLADARALGLLSLALPEHVGGLGVEMTGLIPIYAVLGAFMAPLPVFGTGLAADLLGLVEAEPWLERLANGATAAVALPPHGNVLQITDGADGIFVNGEVEFLLDGADVDYWLLKGRYINWTDAWFVCPAAAGHVAIEPRKLFDETRHAARLFLSEVWLPADHLVAMGGKADRLERRLTAHAALALAADSLGGSQAILEKTLDYLRVREQFSRPIGSFQALKHRSANLHLRLVTTQTLLEEAVAAVEEDRADAWNLAMLAGAYAVDAYAVIAEDALQLHGGIGFTRAHDAHIHLKRAKLNQALLGGSAMLLDRAAGLDSDERP